MVVQENRVIVTEYFVLSLTKMIQIWLFPLVGIRMLKYGILDSQVLVDLSMVLIFVVTQSIFMMASSWLGPIRTTNNSSFGTLVLVSILKTLIGTRAFHPISHALYMHHSSRRTQVILSFQEDQVQMKLKFSMQTTCSNHVHKSEVFQEPASR